MFLQAPEAVGGIRAQKRRRKGNLRTAVAEVQTQRYSLPSRAEKWSPGIG